jgi:RNA polymerase sigma-70 factor (ECF subfamily)
LIDRQEPTAGKLELTQLLVEWGQGDKQALEKVINALYKELRRMARRCLRDERRDISLQSASIVHEAYLRLAKLKQVRWESRSQFYAIAARVMRHILVDHARKARAAKRGGGACKLVLDEGIAGTPEKSVDLVELDGALRKLAMADPQQSRIVELRYFVGLSIEATAKILQLSPTTVKRDWRVAKAFLYASLQGEQPHA